MEKADNVAIQVAIDLQFPKAPKDVEKKKKAGS